MRARSECWCWAVPWEACAVVPRGAPSACAKAGQWHKGRRRPILAPRTRCALERDHDTRWAVQWSGWTWLGRGPARVRLASPKISLAVAAARCCSALAPLRCRVPARLPFRPPFAAVCVRDCTRDPPSHCSTAHHRPPTHRVSLVGRVVTAARREILLLLRSSITRLPPTASKLILQLATTQTPLLDTNVPFNFHSPCVRICHATGTFGSACHARSAFN